MYVLSFNLMRYMCSLTTHSRHKDYSDARSVFEDIHKKRLDWPEAIWDAWVAFEQLHGSVFNIDSALDKIEKARIQVEYHRARVGLTLTTQF